MNAQGFQHRPRCFSHQVIGDLRGSGDFNPGIAGRGVSDIEPVRQGDGLEDGAQFVKTVGAFVENAQAEVQFCVCREAGRPGHLSYWMSENTS